ncbi:sigma-70 family RNA polymerase sigma factor [Gordonia sp. SID5947]|uniref:ECF RNA polymerase sigma factor SigK n=1 Tax=Gordonia sp. SID5947 TaxID=2690315 RepID=UPI0013713B2A|nr:ECF RNA polymerase sigma factor SigK [Gordonia sp. SID5947]MYR08307.1 sigma-70 family RNA polymerase sigma factor [Gordonia sp. SID5947]
MSAALPHLLSRVAQGDHQAFARFYDLTVDRVYGLVSRVLRDPGYSEETTQEIFLHVWRHATDFDASRGSALSWLLTVAHRRAVDRVRSETALARRTLMSGVAGTSIQFDEVSAAAELRDTRQRVISTLDELTPLQRESLVLAYYHGLSYREVSEQLSVGLPTVKARIRDGMRKLRTSLADVA